MTPLEKRIEQLEVKLAQVQYELARKSSREAAQLSPRHGRYVGITADYLNEDNVTVDVTAWLWSATDDEWQESSVVIQNVHAFDDNTPIPLATKVYVFWYETCWVLLPAVSSDIVFFELTYPLRIAEPEPCHTSAVTLLYDAGDDNVSDNADTEEIEVYDPYHITGAVDVDGRRGMWNGPIGARGCAVRRDQGYEAEGVNAVVQLTIPADWWDDDGELVLDVDGNSTGTIDWVTVDRPLRHVADGTGNDFASELAGGLTTALGGAHFDIRIIQDQGNTSTILQIEFTGDYANMAVPVSVDSDSHNTSVLSPTVTSIRNGSDASQSRPAYNIIWMERPAQWIDFQATEYMGEYTAGRILAGVNRFDDQGLDPAMVPGSSVLYDPDSTFGDVITDCEGHAVYNNYLERYEIKNSERMAERATATFSETVCAESDPDTPSISNFSTNAVGEFVRTPSTPPTEVSNPLLIPGANGDKVLLRRTSKSITFDAMTNAPLYGFSWAVINVAPHAFTMVTNVQIDGEELIREEVTVKVWACGNESEQVIADLEDCPPPE